MSVVSESEKRPAEGGNGGGGGKRPLREGSKENSKSVNGTGGWFGFGFGFEDMTDGRVDGMKRRRA